MTSNAPGWGTSISSIWKASFGSPSRSSRITHAAIFSGSVPGSTFTSVTSRVAMRENNPPGVESAGGWYLGGWRLAVGGWQLAGNGPSANCQPSAADHPRGRVVRQRHHAQLRVHAHRGREDARVHHVEVLVAVDAEAIVDDALARVAAHRVAALGV